jgi:hypothetical protein
MKETEEWHRYYHDPGIAGSMEAPVVKRLPGLSLYAHERLPSIFRPQTDRVCVLWQIFYGAI